MLKALFLDLDETLCDTLGANERAKQLMAQDIEEQYGVNLNGLVFADEYVAGIYREWNDDQRERYMPIIEQKSEKAFRLQLIHDLLAERAVDNISNETAQAFQDKFDSDRLKAFDFYPGIAAFLAEARKLFTLVVITNGPEFSQVPKVERVNLAEHVDHIIIGGQEPEEKPAPSIFNKALKLANCQAHEVVHVGDSLASDIAGAHNSGITSVWIQHQQPLDAELGINPHHTVFHPSEIPALIHRLHHD
ncbi:MAG: HAD family hydrolase [Gammaproteobacteria bacterium]|nr:HAD family hydrolase [Gammaproteobacteria bacterium]